MRSSVSFVNPTVQDLRYFLPPLLSSLLFSSLLFSSLLFSSLLFSSLLFSSLLFSSLLFSSLLFSSLLFSSLLFSSLLFSSLLFSSLPFSSLLSMMMQWWWFECAHRSMTGFSSRASKSIGIIISAPLGRRLWKASFDSMSQVNIGFKILLSREYFLAKVTVYRLRDKMIELPTYQFNFFLDTYDSICYIWHKSSLLLIKIDILKIFFFFWLRDIQFLLEMTLLKSTSFVDEL